MAIARGLRPTSRAAVALAAVALAAVALAAVALAAVALAAVALAAVALAAVVLAAMKTRPSTYPKYRSELPGPKDPAGATTLPSPPTKGGPWILAVEQHPLQTYKVRSTRSFRRLGPPLTGSKAPAVEVALDPPIAFE
jgi:hypothetical protein